MNPKCEEQQRALLAGEPPTAHVEDCPDCRSFAAFERGLVLEAPASLVERTLERLRPELSRRARSRRALYWRLSLAGVLSLPIILGANAAIAWIVYTSVERLVSETAAVAATGFTLGSMLLALSLAYGALPLLAGWGFELRERLA